MTLQDGHYISTDGQVIDPSNVEMTEIAIDDEQQDVMDVEQVELTTAELVASATSAQQLVTSSQDAALVAQAPPQDAGQMIQDGGLVSRTQVMSGDGMLTISQWHPSLVNVSLFSMQLQRWIQTAQSPFHVLVETGHARG